MALAIIHTVPIGDYDDVQSGRLNHARIWSVMQEKAADPLEFVPMITESKVVERYDDGFMREVMFFGRDRVLERIRPRKEKHRIMFEVIDHPRLELIFNELDVDAQGCFTYTLTTRFSDAFLAEVKLNPQELESREKLLFDTATASARTIGEKARTRTEIA